MHLPLPCFPSLPLCQEHLIGILSIYKPLCDGGGLQLTKYMRNFSCTHNFVGLLIGWVQQPMVPPQRQTILKWSALQSMLFHPNITKHLNKVKLSVSGQSSKQGKYCPINFIYSGMDILGHLQFWSP